MNSRTGECPWTNPAPPCRVKRSGYKMFSGFRKVIRPKLVDCRGVLFRSLSVPSPFMQPIDTRTNIRTDIRNLADATDGTSSSGYTECAARIARIGERRSVKATHLGNIVDLWLVHQYICVTELPASERQMGTPWRCWTHGLYTCKKRRNATFAT